MRHFKQPIGCQYRNVVPIKAITIWQIKQKNNDKHKEKIFWRNL